MSAAWTQFVVLVAVALAGGSITKMAQIIWKIVRPSISVDLGARTLKTLNEIRTLFGTGSSIGGYLEYPWEIRRSILREDNLRFELEAAAAAVGDRKFEESVEVIKKQLRKIFATAYKPPKNSQTFRNESESVAKFATIQRDAIDIGAASLEIAVGRIHRLLRRNK